MATLDSTDLARIAQHVLGYKTWFVTTGGDDSFGDGSIIAPYLTVSKAITQSSSGDKIFVGAGTFTISAALNCAAKRLTFEGVSATQSIITSTSNQGTVKVYDGCVFRRLSLICTNASFGAVVVQSASMTGVLGPVFEDCILTGTTDCIFLAVPADFATFRRCRISSGFDVYINNGARNLIEDCYLFSDGSSSTVSNENNILPSFDGVIRRSVIYANRDQDATNTVRGIYPGNGPITLEDVDMTINLNGDPGTDHHLCTGDVIGIAENASPSADKVINLTRVKITTYNAGSGHTYDIVNSAGIVNDCGGNRYDSAKISGSATTKLMADNRDQGAIPTALEISSSMAQSSKLIVISPISGSEMTLVKGNAYAVADGTNITLAKQDGETGWPSTVSTIDFSCAPDDQLIAETSSATSTGVDDISLTSITNDGGNLALTAAQTGALVATPKSGRYNFWFNANRGGNLKTVRMGKLKVVIGDTN